MPLPDEHLAYPHRRYGMDQRRYAWRMSAERPPWSLPDGKSVAAVIVVPLEFHRLNPAGKPFKHPGAMQTPYPDLRHYTTRDYGLRVGAFRILRALKAAGLKAVFPVNAVLLERVAPLIEAIRRDGHEIAAYGLEADRIHWGGLDRDTEAGWVAEVRARFARAGINPRTWMSPARQQSFVTFDLIAGQGFDICLDWEMDEIPVRVHTEQGEVTAVPLLNELDDRQLLIEKRQSEDDWAAQVLEALEYLKRDTGRPGGRVLSFTLTPYVTGQPFRIAALRRVLGALGQDPEVWSATTAELPKP